MAGYNPQKHNRRSIRLAGWDYARAGAYFVTVVTHGREPILGRVVEGQMLLSEYGIITQHAWENLPNHYPHVQLDAWVIMPNHVHGVIVLTPVGAGLRPAPTEPAPTITTKRHGLPEIIRAFKSFSARRINACRHATGIPVWQRNYYERIVRNDRELHAIRRYVLANPERWGKDAENPDHC